MLVLAAMLTGGAVWAQDGWFVPKDPYQAELEEDHNVVSEFVTPHTKWGTPWAQGKARVLFFVNGRGTAAREVIELKQRFDIVPQMIYWGRLVDTTRDDWHGGEMGIQRIDRLLHEKWDAYVFLGIKLENLTSEQQFLLLDAVAKGAGLVFSGLEDKRIMKPTNQIKDVPPALADGPVGEAFKLREGRGLRLPGQQSIKYAPGWEVAYDYWAQRLGRGILWAAGKEPQMQLTLEQKTPEVARTALPGHEVKVNWQAPAGLRNLALEVTLRRSDGWSQSLTRMAAAQPTGSATVKVPVLRADDYHVDVIARSARGIENFASATFKVTSPRVVEKITLAQDWGEIGQQFAGQVSLTGSGGANERLVVSLLDRRGRELKRAVTSPVTAEAGFRFPIDAWLPMLVTVRATLLQGNNEVSSNWTFANVTKRNRGQFNFLMWDVPTGTLAPYAQESLARNNVTLQLGSNIPPPYVAAHDIAWVPYTTHIYNKRDDKGVMQPSCWNDEENFQAHVDEIVQKQLPARRHGVFAYSLGDEIAVRGSCLSPHCLAAYQRYLEQEYKTIAALNSSWGTQLKSFSEVQLSKADDNDEAEAFRNGNFPRWFDRQAYQSYNFCKLCERFGEGFRTIDPQSLCGFEGAGTFRDGDDLDGFVRANTFWAPYPGTADEVLRSIAPRDFPRANWMGYTKDADTLLLQYWRMVTRGCDSVWWWRWEVIGRFHGWLAPSLDPYPAVKEIIKDTQILREGLGDLLLQCEMLDDGIGMMFSQPSAYANKVQHSPSYGGYQNEHVAWHNNLRDLGLNFNYFTDRQLRLGEAKLDRFKLIVLSQTQAMGPREAEELRKFVEAGGVLVADVRPGIYDGHVKPLTSGLLDDVFGIKREKFAESVITDGQLSGNLGGQAVKLDIPKARVDAGITAAKAQSLGRAGEAPLFLVNNFGRGKAVLLNLSMSSYPLLSSETTPEAAAQVLQALCKLAQVQPAVALQDASGKRLRNVEVTRWRNGETELISVFRHRGLGQPIRLSLSGNQRLYDLKQRQDLGQKASYNLSLTPYRAMFFAATARPAEAAVVTVSKATAAPGEVLQARVAFPGARSLRAAHLRVKLPNGQDADWLSQTVVAGARGATVTIPVAFNDPPGVYTLSATELYGNRTGTAQITVKGVK
jgi:hypothetical protein